jgi:hypothetical protein
MDYYFTEVNEFGPVGIPFTQPIFQQMHPDIDINNLPENFSKLILVEPPENFSDTEYQVTYVKEGDVFKIVYVTVL